MCLFESESVPTGEITPTYIWPPGPDPRISSRTPELQNHRRPSARGRMAGRKMQCRRMLAAKLRDPE
jgi:hypothetical protein